ncbi:hypothetical protein E2C01_045759 [Portunus trituberculatus]|uniref:Uncharacterized protein n=1 Tax=Portunus trituberculatus TaxID=210409 RepID=A0A5B7FZ48_PORTR|nr:hypothetical protein [Portunus trituberculatus]
MQTCCILACLHLRIPTFHPAPFLPLVHLHHSLSPQTPLRESATRARGGLSLLVLAVRHHAKPGPDRDPALPAICTNERDSSGRDVVWSCSIMEQPCLCACVN